MIASVMLAEPREETVDLVAAIRAEYAWLRRRMTAVFIFSWISTWAVFVAVVLKG